MKYKKIIKISILVIGILGIVSTVIAATNIDSTNRWAWSDLSGWWDFYNSNTVEVTETVLTGYAESDDVGEMALNCASTPSGDICSSSNFKVTNPNNSGELAGCAWNDNIGWISFWCGDTDCDGSSTEDGGSICSTSNYRVTLGSNGTFTGYAWNDVEGWISFNCSDNGTCSSSNYKVEASWSSGAKVAFLQSAIIDTGKDAVTLQSIIWHGTQPAGTSVDFQIAVATSTDGPWTYAGPGDDTEIYYGRECPIAGQSDPAAGPGKAICVDKNITKENRYLRYKVRLISNEEITETPTINDIILNWSE